MIVVSSSAVRAGEPSLLVLRPLTETPFLTGAAWPSGACRGFCMGSMTVSAPDTTSGVLYVAACLAWPAEPAVTSFAADLLFLAGAALSAGAAAPAGAACLGGAGSSAGVLAGRSSVRTLADRLCSAMSRPGHGGSPPGIRVLGASAACGREPSTSGSTHGGAPAVRLLRGSGGFSAGMNRGTGGSGIWGRAGVGATRCGRVGDGSSRGGIPAGGATTGLLVVGPEWVGSPLALPAAGSGRTAAGSGRTAVGGGCGRLAAAVALAGGGGGGSGRSAAALALAGRRRLGSGRRRQPALAGRRSALALAGRRSALALAGRQPARLGRSGRAAVGSGSGRAAVGLAGRLGRTSSLWPGGGRLWLGRPASARLAAAGLARLRLWPGLADLRPAGRLLRRR